MASNFSNYDEKSGYSLTNLSFLLDLIVPLKHLQSINNPAVTTQIRTDLLEGYSDNAHIQHTVGGRTFYGCSIPPFFNYSKNVLKPIEFHMVENTVKELALSNTQWVADVQRALCKYTAVFEWNIVAADKVVDEEASQGSTTKFLLDYKETSPGYTRLKIINPSKTDDLMKSKVKSKGDFYLSSKALEIDIRENMYSKFQHISDVESKYQIDLRGVEQYLERVGYSSAQVVLPCKSWPNIAQKFTQRHRSSGWPNETLINDIIRGGVYLLPIAHFKSKASEVEWKFHFDMAEKLLALSFNDVQKQIVALLYTLMYYCFEEENVKVDFKYVLTAVFWCSEEIMLSHWKPESLGHILIQVLDKMIAFFSNSQFPCYFIDSCNLIAHLRSNERKNILKILKDLRKDPIKYLVDFTESYQLLYLPYSTEMSLLLQALLLKHKNKDDEQQVKWKVKQIHVLNLIGLQYLKEFSFVEACETYERSATIRNAINPSLLIEPIENILNDAPKIDEVGLVNLYKHLLACYPDSKYRCYILEQLGMEFHVLCYKEHLNQHDKNKYQQQADEYYSCAVTMPTCPVQSKLLYAHFLYRLKEYKLAINIIENILNNESYEDELLDTVVDHYKPRHIHCLDNTMQKLLELNNNLVVVIPCFALGHYVLTMCYLTTGAESYNKDQAEVIYVKFKLSLDKLRVRSTQESSINNSRFLLKALSKMLGHSDDYLQ